MQYCAVFRKFSLPYSLLGYDTGLDSLYSTARLEG